MVFSPSFHKLRRAQRHIFFKVLSVFDHFAHHRGADVLKLRLRDQQHRFERAVRHIAIDERKLLLFVPFGTMDTYTRSKSFDARAIMS